MQRQTYKSGLSMKTTLTCHYCQCLAQIILLNAFCCYLSKCPNNNSLQSIEQNIKNNQCTLSYARLDISPNQAHGTYYEYKKHRPILK